MISTLVTKCSNGTKEEKTKEIMVSLKIYVKVPILSILQESTTYFSYRRWMEQNFLEVLSMVGCSSIISIKRPKFKALFVVYKIVLKNIRKINTKIEKQRKIGHKKKMYSPIPKKCKF